jgi:NAD(P)H dehydrogenase (quinone)
MSAAGLMCASCGAVWMSESARELAERSEGCLRCGGRLLALDALTGSKEKSPAFAVTGFAGALGARIAARLARLGAKQRLLVHDDEQASGLDGEQAPGLDGAEVVRASHDDDRAMNRALAGIRTLFLASAKESPELVQQHVAALDAASAAGVERIVYLSFLAAAADATYTWARDHFQVEQHARATGISCTFLRPSPYIDLAPLLCSAEGVIRNPAADGRVARVTRDDVAEVAVIVLIEDEHGGHTYDLTGSEAHTMAEVARELELAAGRSISYVEETLEEAWASRSKDGGPDWEVEALVTCFAAIAAGELDLVSDTVDRLTGHQPQTLRGYLDEHPESCAHIVGA